MTIKLIIGLGNPGAEYAKTRHNVGAWFIDTLAASLHAEFKKEKKFTAEVAKVSIDGHECYLLKPLTFMNDSGHSVQAAAHFYKVAPKEMLIAHDELDFPVGQVKLKVGGGHGGHNGLRDIAEKLASTDFLRLRIGIEHPGHKDRVTAHVLNAPSAHDKKLIDDSIIDALRVLPDVINGKIEKAMRDLH